MLTGMPVVSRLCIDATELAACYRLKCSGYRFGQRTSPTLKRLYLHFVFYRELFKVLCTLLQNMARVMERLSINISPPMVGGVLESRKSEDHHIS
jgi:hypothetical protein